MTFGTTSGLSDKETTQICDVFRKFSDVEQAVIFGSRAMGNFKIGSDIDLVLKGNLHPKTLTLIKTALEEESYLPYFFDIIVYDQIENPALKHHVDIYGRIFYQA